MGGIVAVGDVHEGINFGIAIDPETGVCARAMDIHRNFARTAEFAIKNSAELFVVVGDLFDRTHVSPVFREMIRTDVIEPLGDAGIPVWILAGNHDQPQNERRGTSIDDFRGYPHVNVYRNPDAETVEINGTSTGCIILPYLHPSHIASLVEQKKGEKVSTEEMFLLGQELLKAWMQNRTMELETDYKVLLAHYYVEGAKLRETNYPEVLPGEFSLRRDMIPQEVDLAVFGHIHLHQEMGANPPIVYTGAVERVDWGERGDEKGFLFVEPDKDKWTFQSLPAREMLKIEIQISSGEDATQKILDSMPSQVEDKLVRLEIVADEAVRSTVDDALISERLDGTFHHEVRWKEAHHEKIGPVDFSMDPFTLTRSFIDVNFHEHPQKDELLEHGERILREVLQ